MICGYEFTENTDTWASDKHGATSALQVGAAWQDERTSAKGVLNFSGKGDYVVIDDSAVKSDALQISFAVLWSGGKNDEIFHFGDDTAYMSFTPENSQDNAEFTITNGDNIRTLTAQKALAKGEWSKVTIRIIDGQGELLINGQLADSKQIFVTTLNVLSASEDDCCILGGFKGAVDYCNFYFKAVDEPNITYSGSEPINEKLMGGVNADGKFNVADLVALQNWLLGRDKTLVDWEAGNFIDDGRLDVFDLVMMRRALIS